MDIWILDLYHCLMSPFSPHEGGSLLEACPCVLGFISTVVSNTASDPGVLSFTLKLTGLVAATEDGFKMLQVDVMTRCTFTKFLATISDPPYPLVGLLCSGPGLQPSALARSRALGGSLFTDWLDPGLKELAAAPKGSRFLCTIR